MNDQSLHICFAVYTNNTRRITGDEDLARDVTVILWLMCCPKGLIR